MALGSGLIERNALYVEGSRLKYVIKQDSGLPCACCSGHLPRNRLSAQVCAGDCESRRRSADEVLGAYFWPSGVYSRIAWP